MEIKVKKIHEDAKLPFRQYEGDACYDLYAVEEITIEGDGTQKIKFGIQWELPRGFCAIVFARSSSFANKGLKVNTGIVDQQYRGEIICLVSLTSPHPVHTGAPMDVINSYTVKKGESIAQVMFLKLPSIILREVQKLSKTDRQESGFGSTG